VDENAQDPDRRARPHLERYAEFFDAHGISGDDPLGAFRTGELPEAPATPDRLEDGEPPRALGGYTDDACVETDNGEVIPGGTDEPEAVDPGSVLGLEDQATE
jgi:hypothetical protein